VIALERQAVAALAGGELIDESGVPALVTGPVIVDSRNAAPGSLFVAVAGSRVDGHDFAADAVEAGAALVLADRPLRGLPVAVVPDTVQGLGRLAHGLLDSLPGVHVVAVTGSSGKTGTKDLIAILLEQIGNTVAPVNSFNTEIGVPLTILSADRDTKFLVLEMGARGVGHIRALAAIARPDVAVVLNVGSAHVGEFGSRDAIAKAKSELVEALPDSGLAVLNADDPLVRAMAERTSARVVTFGAGGRNTAGGVGDLADVRAADVSLQDGRARFRLVAAGQSADVRLRLIGIHHVSNCIAAAAVAIDAGMQVSQVASLLSSADARSRWRMETTRRADGVTVINDAYNANPESMRAAIEALMAVAAGRRTWAVLGPMAELGAHADAEHESLGRFAAARGVSHIVVVGPHAEPIVAGVQTEPGWSGRIVTVSDADSALELLADQIRPGDVVLVKASRAAGLERLAIALTDGVAE